MLHSPSLVAVLGPPGLALLLGCAVVHPPRPLEAAPAATSSGPEPRPEVEAPRRPAPRDGERGKASYYADSLAGRKTASGERYDTKQLTAAHRTLPFGTKLKVTNQRNGKSVIVRINDRGPFIKGRVIDLSRGAARQLGFISAGVTNICMAKA